MKRMWTYLKALWIFWQANGELIEKHVLWLKSELAERNLEKAVKAAGDAKAAIDIPEKESKATSMQE